MNISLPTCSRLYAFSDPILTPRHLILPQYGIGVPNGEVARTPEEAEAIAKKIGMHMTR